ncbi:MAG: glutaminase [Pseudomonadota bacterium]
MTDLHAAVAAIAARAAHATERGAVATYIPELAHIDPAKFGIAVVTAPGEEIVAGDADEPFSIQSVSKVFTLMLALDAVGADLWRRVGREPSGNPFNSIVQLERESGVPRNPFINAGAIVVADVLLADSRDPDAALERIVGFLRRLSGDHRVHIDAPVARSEMTHGARNRALAHFMAGYGNLHHPVEDVLRVYFHACAIAMSCRQLARAGRCLAFGGRTNGASHSAGEAVCPAERARRINALMLTCGHYDGSGEFAYRVGLPGKSGVGGGILAIVPGRAAIAAWSPGLDPVGNSTLASRALGELTATMGWSVFAG